METIILGNREGNFNYKVGFIISIIIFILINGMFVIGIYTGKTSYLKLIVYWIVINIFIIIILLFLGFFAIPLFKFKKIYIDETSINLPWYQSFFKVINIECEKKDIIYVEKNQLRMIKIHNISNIIYNIIIFLLMVSIFNLYDHTFVLSIKGKVVFYPKILFSNDELINKII